MKALVNIWDALLIINGTRAFNIGIYFIIDSFELGSIIAGICMASYGLMAIIAGIAGIKHGGLMYVDD